MNKLHSVLLALGAAFLTYLVWRVGPAELWRGLVGLGWGIVPLILSEGVANLAHTVGWRCCLNPRNRTVSLIRLFRVAMAGFAINYLTPSASVGGEVTKAALLAGDRPGAEAAGSVVVDKLSLALAHLLCVLVGAAVVLGRVQLPPALWIALMTSSLLVTAGIVAFFLIQKHGKLGAAIRWMVRHRIGARSLSSAAESITKVDESLKVFYRERPADMIRAVGWHLVGHSVGLLQTWMFLRLLDQRVALSAVVSATLIGLWFDLVTFAVPLGMGSLEGGRLVALKAAGCGAPLGVAYGMALRFAQLFWAAFGLLNYAWLAPRGFGGRRAPTAQAQSQRPEPQTGFQTRPRLADRPGLQQTANFPD